MKKLKYPLIALIIAILFSTSAVAVGAKTAEAPMPEDREEVTEEAAGGEESFFGKVYEELSEYATEILSALTLVGSLTLAIAYKKGLLPLVEKSLVTIGNAITKIKDTASESAEQSTALSLGIENKLTEAVTTLDSLAKKVALLDKSLTERIRDESETERGREQLRIIAEAQIDMLYDVFMTSALPQYQKDAVGERIAKMREAIGRDEAK